jgi:hypothetical protein
MACSVPHVPRQKRERTSAPLLRFVQPRDHYRFATDFHSERCLGELRFDLEPCIRCSSRCLPRRVFSRLDEKFQIVIGQLAITPSGKDVHDAGNSIKVDGTNGNVIKELPRSFDGPFGIFALGAPSVADRTVQIAGLRRVTAFLRSANDRLQLRFFV